MIFKDTLVAELSEYDFEDLKVDREHVQNGVPATLVSLNRRRNGTLYRHTWTFAKDNVMSAEDIADVIKSYLKD